MQISKLQLKSVGLAQELATFLAQEIPDVETVDIERHEAFEDHELPAVEIKINEEEVLNAKTLPPSLEEGSSNCCQHIYKVRQFYTINVIVNNCDGAYAQAGVIQSYIEQILCQTGEFIYGGTTPLDEREDQSSENLYVRSIIYYIDYEKP